MEKKSNLGSEIVFYQTEDGRTRLEVRLENETVWLTQNQMAELFQTTKQNVGQHIQNIFSESELREVSVVKEFFTTAADGKKYKTKFYNLDVIISVGYRVKSLRGTQFRIWATQRLRELIVKGFTLDDERLKQGGAYFDELLARIREIRASEKNFYQKIKDLYVTSVDYDEHAEITQDFFAMAQNKLHWAIHGHTAAEVIVARANAARPNMGLTTWSGGKVRKHDIHVAKNYLNEEEMGLLNLIVTQYLDFAEFQARTRKVMYMREWARKLDDFLRVNDRDILQGFGKVSAQLAREKAELEYEKFQRQQRQIGDAKAAEELAAELKVLEEKAKQAAQPKPKQKKK
ncbi:MAG TPA: virulence RhuM family protein [Verrucomicrobiae bacterium]